MFRFFDIFIKAMAIAQAFGFYSDLTKLKKIYRKYSKSAKLLLFYKVHAAFITIPIFFFILFIKNISMSKFSIKMKKLEPTFDSESILPSGKLAAIR